MPETDVAEIARLEAERAHAIVSADRTVLAALTDDDYVHVEASGQVRDKEGFLAGVASDAGRFESYVVIENHIRLFGGTALVTGVFENCFVHTGGERSMKRARHIRVYIRRGDGWRNVSHQATLLYVLCPATERRKSLAASK